MSEHMTEHRPNPYYPYYNSLQTSACAVLVEGQLAGLWLMSERPRTVAAHLPPSPQTGAATCCAAVLARPRPPAQEGGDEG